MNKKILNLMLEIFFLIIIYTSGLYFRLLPRLEQDPHLLTFEADIWYRITMAQNLLDHGHLPKYDIRYEAYLPGSADPADSKVPFWYPPLGLYSFVFLSKISGLDLPTVSSRIIPLIESLAPFGLYFFCRFLLGRAVAVLATLFLALTPSFVFWSGISDPQSFILFMIPILLLLWIKHVQWTCVQNPKTIWRCTRLIVLGLMLAISFLTHLFFFLMVPILILVTIALFLEKVAQRRIWLDLFVILLLSQIFTVWWWAPKNLYKWWFFSLVTSSGNYPAGKMLIDFGMIAGIIGIYFLIFLIYKAIFKKGNPIPFSWVVIFWAILPFLETQNESILALAGRLDLSWSTIFKPLEGFRFYVFLAQPLSVCFGMGVVHLTRSLPGNFFGWKKKSLILNLPVIFILLLTDIHLGYNFWVRIKNAGVALEEIRAAQWFRENSKSTDRIIADYYHSYIFAGFSGGKALLGMAFPLRRSNLPYISQNNYTVPDDIYRIYTTDNPAEAVELMKRYGATHLFISANMASSGNFITKGFGVSYNFNTLQNTEFFQPVYQETGKVVILERIR